VDSILHFHHPCFFINSLINLLNYFLFFG
jgi:hypothetical protein